jgi:GPH family glycoside/pentoside/hexuronide:cation symporter
MAPTPTPAGTGKWADAPYGLMGLPLAFVALPLYVHLPPHLALTLGWSLTMAGGVLLAVRVFDALIDPALGRWTDRLLARSPRHLLGVSAVAALAVVLGLFALFGPDAGSPLAHGAVVTLALVLAGTANSLLSIAHQTWGAALPRTDDARSRLFAWREGAGLVGVLVASALPAVVGWTTTLWVLAAAMAIGWLAWTRAEQPAHHPADAAASRAHSPWACLPFRKLMAVFVLNGIAGAVPATLVVLFMTDRLGASANWQAALLTTYFASAALGLPLWLRGVQRWGLPRTWGAGMVLAVLAFSATALLGTGDLWAFAAICALSGLTLGADLALPSALLAKVLDDHPAAHAHRGLYVGWWALAAKLNLALAAGLALPLLGLWGYQPGSADPQGLAALSLAYSSLPGVLKLAAALLLYVTFIRHTSAPAGALSSASASSSPSSPSSPAQPTAGTTP